MLRQPLLVIALIITSAGWQRDPNKEDGQTPLSQLQSRVIRVEEHPSLGAEYAQVSSFKLASRKTRYRFGEIISLDLALLNKSNMPLFFHDLFTPNIFIRGRRQKDKEVLPYLILDRVATSRSFHLALPGEMVTHSIQLLIGCDEQALKQIEAEQNDTDDRVMFDSNLFLNWGQGCLNVSHPGNYKITVSQSNQYVVLNTTAYQNAKTATGTIRSSPLNITIIK